MSKSYYWDALGNSRHPLSFCNDSSCSGCSGCRGRRGRRGVVDNEADLVSDIDQSSHELIVIRNSCDINVETTDTQVAVSLQAALQVAIAVVINLTIADNARAEQVTQELIEFSQIRQTNRQKLIIENSKCIEVQTTDTDVAISLQVLLQILLVLLIILDIF